MPGFHLNTVKGLEQTLHSAPNYDLVILRYGFSPRHVSHSTGKSAYSQPCLAGPDRIPIPLSPPAAFIFGYNLYIFI